jgi:hypothetical protein
MAKKKDKIEVEIEAGGRELEIEIDPETGAMTVEEEDESEQEEDASGPDEGDGESPARPAKRGSSLFLGLLLGALIGATAARVIVRQLAGTPSEGAQNAQDGPEAATNGLLGSFGGRWREARREGQIAAREAERKALARYRELTGNGPR